jgi:general secretion pathway protein C
MALTTAVFFIAQIISFQLAQQLRIPLQPVFAPPDIVFKKREAKGIEAYASILARNIFNLHPPVVVPGTSAAEAKIVIPIRLLGTVAGEEEAYAYAIIEDPYQKVQRIFKLEDTVAPGVQLIEIGRNKITILRDGVREEIEPAGDSGGFSRAPGLPSGPLQPPGLAAPEGPSAGVIDKREMEAATQDVNRLMTQARLVPNFSGGVADGFRIFSIVPGSLYERAGLRNGDILQNINGIELKDPEKALQIYQLLKDNDRFTMVLVRAGQKMTLNYEVR